LKALLVRLTSPRLDSARHETLARQVSHFGSLGAARFFSPAQKSRQFKHMNQTASGVRFLAWPGKTGRYITFHDLSKFKSIVK